MLENLEKVKKISNHFRFVLKTETVSGTLSSVEIKNPFGTFWPGSVKWDTLYNSGKQNRFGKGQEVSMHNAHCQLNTVTSSNAQQKS